MARNIAFICQDFLEALLGKPECLWLPEVHLESLLLVGPGALGVRESSSRAEGFRLLLLLFVGPMPAFSSLLGLHIVTIHMGRGVPTHSQHPPSLSGRPSGKLWEG